MPSHTKLQRWIDLLSTLLGHKYPLTFEQIACDVPAYILRPGMKEESIKRTFERDKKELKALGVPIETVEGQEGEARYRIQATDFYLPYLFVRGQHGPSQPARVDAYSYRSLAKLTFEAEELSAIAEGAARARQLGSAPLREDIDSALRKLAVDLPVDAGAAGATTRVLTPRAVPDPTVLHDLADALHARKIVVFDYQALGSPGPESRTVEPYGLFFLNAHWYLVGRDQARSALRNFRINRISRLRQQSPAKEVAEYRVPESFDLREHATSRSAWELGDTEGIEAIVEFRGSTGAARAAAALGAPVDGEPRQRRFVVRRRDVFVRWLLALRGDAVPVAPPALRTEFARQIEAVRRIYSEDAESGASA